MDPLVSDCRSGAGGAGKPRCSGTRRARAASGGRSASPGRRLPGGARIVELWSAPERLTVAADGDLDAFDAHALIDVLTGQILRGARRIRFDAQHVGFFDISALRALHRVDRFLARSGGSLTLTGLRQPFELAWVLIDAVDADGRARVAAARIGIPVARTATTSTGA